MRAHLYSRLDQVSSEATAAYSHALGSDRILSLLGSDARSRRRAMARVMEVAGLPAHTIFSTDTERVAAFVFADLTERLETVCGLIVYGQYIRSCVSRTQYAELCTNFAVEDINLACRLRELHVLHGENLINWLMLPALVASAGHNAVAAWLSSVDEPARKSLLMARGASRFNNVTPGFVMDRNASRRLVEAAALELAGDHT